VNLIEICLRRAQLSRGETEFPLLLFFLASRCLGGSISWRLDLPLHPKIKKQRLAPLRLPPLFNKFCFSTIQFFGGFNFY